MSTLSLFSPAEAKRFFRLGLPIFIAQLAQTGMMFVDCVMTGHYSATAMAAIAIASSLYAPLSMLGIGTFLVLSPLASQLVGGGRPEEASHLLRQALWLVLSLGGLLVGALACCSLAVEAMGLAEPLARETAGYLRAVMWGLPGFLLFMTIRAFFEGFARTRPAMIVALLTLVLNIPSNALFIYGLGPLPPLGATGCGLATSLCSWCMPLLLLGLLYRDANGRRHDPFFFRRSWHFSVDPPLLRKILKTGLPNALALCAEVALFALTAILLAPCGTTVVAGHQLAMNYASLLFMVPLSLGLAATIRTGFCLGAGRLVQAKRVAVTALVLGLGLSVCSALGTILLRRHIVTLYTEDAAVHHLALGLLVIQAAYQIPDFLQTMASSILRGYNDTRVISVICAVSCLGLGLPLGILLGRTSLLGLGPLGAAGFWYAYILALSVNALGYLWRIRYWHTREATSVAAWLSAKYCPRRESTKG